MTRLRHSATLYDTGRSLRCGNGVVTVGGARAGRDLNDLGRSGCYHGLVMAGDEILREYHGWWRILETSQWSNKYNAFFK